MKAKINLIQFDTAYKQIDVNIARMAKLIDEAASDSPDLIVMPELWTTGYSVELFHDKFPFAQSADGSAMQMVCAKAKEHHVWVVAGSMLELDDGEVYNTAFLVNREGEIAGKYRKMHLYGPMDESLLGHGTESPVFDTDFGRIALMTCYDLRFVELSRSFALQGAELIVVVSNWAKPKLKHWQVMLQSRAIENQVPLVACNRVGTALDFVYFGHSLAVDAYGEMIQEDDTEEERILRNTIDMDKIWDVRKQITMYADRHPECYPQVLLQPYDGRKK